MAYLLDTNILSDLVRAPGGRIAGKISQLRGTVVRTSIVVVAELRFGIVKRGSTRLAANLDVVLNNLDVEPLASPADQVYAEIRTHLERAGTPIGANDLLIAAHALALGDTLVTDNEREFQRVPRLDIENWLR